MKTREVAEVALGVLGVYCILQAALTLPPLVCIWTWNEGSAGLAGQAGRLAVSLAFGIALVCIPGRIASWLLRYSNVFSEDLEFKIVSPDGFRLCLRVIGVFTLLKAVELLAQEAVRANLNMQAYEPIISLGTAMSFLPGLLVLALAIYLLRGGEWIIRFAWKELPAVTPNVPAP